MSDDEPTTSFPRNCKICQVRASKYCCPRCNILYCSMDCYKSEAHLQCSESFYRDCVNEEMGIIDPDPSTKRKMMEILSRMQKNEETEFDSDDPESMMKMLNQAYPDISDDADDNSKDSDENFEDITEEDVKDSDDEDSIPDLATRLKEVDLDDADVVWQLLTEDEKKEFESLLHSGDVTKILPSWQPWWLYHKEKKLIEEVDGSKLVKEEPDYHETCPDLYKSVKDFSSLSKQTPAVCVKYNLLNILCSYVYTVRMFNGEHIAFCSESVSCFASICNNLKNGTNFDNAETAIESVVQECHNNPSIISDSDTKNTMLHDLKCLLNGPDDSNKDYYMNCALSDIHALLNFVKKCNKESDSEKDLNTKNKTKGEFSKRFADHQILNLPQISKDKIKIYIKKMEYYLSYLKDYNNEVRFSFVF